VDKLKQEFEWELPMPIPQFVVSEADLDEMLKETKSMLPAKDCEAKESQFVVTVSGKRGIDRREIDNNQMWSILGYLQRYTALKYKNLSLEILNLEDYSKTDKRHPLSANTLELLIQNRPPKNQPIPNYKKRK